MLLNKLTLKNFGVFEDLVEINLRPATQEKPLILIYGKNGSGKTTILEAIRIALYGSLVFGTRAVTDKYLNYVSLRLNRNTLTEASSIHFVSLSLDITEQGISNEYTITREWRVVNDQIRENVSVSRNGHQLSNRHSTDFEHYIKRFLPISVFDMLFLDGEHLNALFEDNKFQVELGTTLMPLCGLDVYKLLNRDLDTFLRTENTYTTLDHDQTHYQQVEARYRSLQEHKQAVMVEIENLQQEIAATKTVLSAYESDLKNYGVQEISLVQQEMNKLEQHRKELNEAIKAFIADILPFVIARPIVQQTVEQLKREESNTKSRQVRDFLRSPSVRQYIVSTINTRGLQDLNMIDSILDALSQAPFLKDNAPLIHNLSHEQAASLINVWTQICKDDFNLPFAEIAATSSALAALRKQKSLAEDAEIVTLMNRLKTTSALVGGLESDLQKLHELLAEIEQNLTATQLELEKAAELVFQSKRDENIFLLTHRLKTVLHEFVQAFLSSSTVELGNRITAHFLNILRKQHFVGRIQVDSNSLELQMFDHNARPISPISLSAGEKQLLVLSVLWALLEVSDRQLPLVFDTLIGRLDSTHKGKVLSEVLPRIGRQVILLATDTEVNRNDYLALKPFLGRIIHLNYFDDAGKTVPREMITGEFQTAHVSTDH